MNQMIEELHIQFSRQIKLSQIGKDGQNQLFNARVGIFGIGGLGSWSSMLCAQIGIGYIRLVDRDVVELSNLPRTPIFDKDSIDLPKVEQGEKFLQKLNPLTKIDAHAVNIDNNNINDLIDQLDVVIDGLDSFKSRYIVNNACQKKRIPYIFAGGLAEQSNMSTFTYRNNSPCLACFFENIEDASLPTCETAGVHTSLLAITASFQVSEVIKVITNNKPRLEGKLAYFDLNNFSLDLLNIKKNPNCRVCGSVTFLVKNETKDKIIELCGNKSFMIFPKPRKMIDVVNILDKVESKYDIRKKGKLGITFTFEREIMISVFKGGNILIRGITKDTVAKEIYKKILPLLQ